MFVSLNHKVRKFQDRFLAGCEGQCSTEGHSSKSKRRSCSGGLRTGSATCVAMQRMSHTYANEHNLHGDECSQ
jgi:hypothetical protein